MLRSPLFVCLLLFSMTVGMAACVSSNGPSDPTDPRMNNPAEPNLGDSDAPDPEDIVSGVATVQYIDLEGGFYGLIMDDSTRYDPGTSLPDDFREDGQRVRVRAVRQDDVMTTRMWGTPIEILDIAPIDL